LLPTDFSRKSNTALPFALALANVYGSTPLLAHVLPPEPLRQIVLDQLPAQDDLAWQAARHQLDILEHDRSLAEVPRKELVDRGVLADVIPAID